MACNCENSQDRVDSCSSVWIYFHNFYTKPWRWSEWTEKCSLSIVTWHQEGKRGNGLAKDEANKDAVGQVTGVPFAARKRGHQEHLTGWVVCHGCRQSNTYPLQITESELLQGRLTLRVAVGLLAGHTDPKAHLFIPDTWCSRIADYLKTLKKMAYISCAIARLLFAKGTESGVVCFWGLGIWNTWEWTP